MSLYRVQVRGCLAAHDKPRGPVASIRARSLATGAELANESKIKSICINDR